METVHIGNAILHRVDAREVLPSIRADVILTDPVWPNCPPGLLAGSEDPHGLWADTMAAMPADISRLIAVLCRDSDPRFLAPAPARLRFLCSLTLPWQIPGNLGRVPGGYEVAYWFGSCIRSAKGRHLIPGHGPVAQSNSVDRRSGHPCPRSQTHFDWLVERCTDVGEVVCDPYMGSGTTAVAAVRAGRPFVGVEIDGRHFETACRKVDEAGRQGDLVRWLEAA